MKKNYSQESLDKIKNGRRVNNIVMMVVSLHSDLIEVSLVVDLK